MSKNKIKIKSLTDLKDGAQQFLQLIGNNKVIAFYGEMGVGKTTFIKALCNELDVIDVVNSPTFAIINEYHTRKEEIIFHFDFYRIENIQEAFDFGYEDYFYSNNICLIEWPEKIERLLPENTLHVLISENEKQERVLEFQE